MRVSLNYDPEKTKALRAKGASLAEHEIASRQAITEAMREGDLDKARSVLEKASLAVREYEDFRKNFTPKEILLAKYGVEVINDHTVLFVIPKGVSRIEILEEVQGLIKHPKGRPFIHPKILAEWKQEDRFSSKQSTSKRICIDGHVRGGVGKTRDEQEAFLGEEFTMANLEDLAVAFCLHWVATGEPLFGWYNRQEGWSYEIRAVGGGLSFYDLGLGSDLFDDDDDDDGGADGVSACVSLE